MLLNNSTAPYEQIECHQMTSQTTSNGVIFFNLNSKVINTSLHTPCHGLQLLMNAIIYRKGPNLHRCCNSEHLSYRAAMTFEEMPAKACFARQVNRPTSFPTDLNQTDKVNQRMRAKFQALAFDSDISSPTSAMPMHQQRRYAENISKLSGCQDI